MNGNEIRQHETPMGFDVAQKMAIETFFERHPRESLPSWVDQCVTTGGFQISPDAWVIEFTMIPKVQLNENEFWEMRNGRKVLAMTDLVTGEKRIIIHRSSGEPIVVFRAKIYPTISYVEVDSDFLKMDENFYEKRMR